MFQATKHCLRNLTNLNGRDQRSIFWPYLIAVSVFCGLNLVVLDAVATALFGAPSARQNGWSHPVGITNLTGLILNGGLAVFLLFAASIRRCQDSGASARTTRFVFGSYLIFITLAVTFGIATGFGEGGNIPNWLELALFGSMLPFALTAQFGSLWLLYLWIRKGTEGPNQFAPDPRQQNFSQLYK